MFWMSDLIKIYKWNPKISWIIIIIWLGKCDATNIISSTCTLTLSAYSWVSIIETLFQNLQWSHLISLYWYMLFHTHWRFWLWLDLRVAYAVFSIPMITHGELEIVFTYMTLKMESRMAWEILRLLFDWPHAKN